MKEEIHANRTQNQVQENIKIAKGGERENKVQKVQDKRVGEISHVRMGGYSAQTLLGPKNAVKFTLKSYSEVEFRVQSVPA